MGSIREDLPTGYDADFFRWTQETAELLRQGRFEETDKENLAEEVADLGKRDRREMQSRMIALVKHLMKWAVQPQLRETSTWLATINEQRTQIDGVLEQSPSLRAFLVGDLPSVYAKAAKQAAIEMHIPLAGLQAMLGSGEPLPAELLLSEDFLPGNSGDLVR